jgi:HSP20 family protein
MLGYWDPFAEMSRVQDRFFGRPSLEREQVFRPAVDIYEDAEGIAVKADLAGVKPEDIKVEVENKVLTISGQRQLENSKQREGYHRVERFYGSFSRSFALSDDVSPDEIDAKYENGVLTVRLPKRPTAKRREIQVKPAA